LPEQAIDLAAKTRERRGNTVFTCYAVTCLACGYRRTMKRADANKAVKNGSCNRCSARVKGAMGYRAAVARHGVGWVLPHVQAWQREHPSTPERVADTLVAALGAPYERQHMLQTRASGKAKWGCLLDFLIDTGGARLAVEVNGFWHHKPQQQRADRRKRALCKRRGIVLVVIDSADLDTWAGRDRAWWRLNTALASLAAVARRDRYE